MFETIKSILVSFFTYLGAQDPLKVGILLFGAVFAYLMLREHNSGKLDWTDLITAKGSNKVSLTKLLQLIGGIIGSWIMIYMTFKGKLTADIFMIYLAYVGAIDGWSKFVAARYGGIPGSSLNNSAIPTVNAPRPVVPAAPAPVVTPPPFGPKVSDVDK